MNFLQAIEEMKNGKKVTRKDWPIESYIYIKDNIIYLRCKKNNKETHEEYEVIQNDWMIYDEPLVYSQLESGKYYKIVDCYYLDLIGYVVRKPTIELQTNESFIRPIPLLIISGSNKSVIHHIHLDTYRFVPMTESFTVNIPKDSEDYVYKVVKYDYDSNNSYISSFVSNEKYKLSYKIGEETKPKIGKIFVFDSVENAEEYIKNLDQGFVLRCKYSGKKEKPKEVCLNHMTATDMELYWNNKLFTLDTPIKGTLFVDTVTPIEIIK